MRKWSQYEAYLYKQSSFFGYEEDEGNEYPAWIADELCAYQWMRELWTDILYFRTRDTLSIALQEQMKNAVSHECARYSSLSPELTKAITGFASDIRSAYMKLKENPAYWISETSLTKAGNKFLEEAVEAAGVYRNVEPNPEWRIQREREIAFPALCRYDAFEIARSAVEGQYHIHINVEGDRDISPSYDVYNTSKNGVLSVVLHKTYRHIDFPFIDLCTTYVDLNTGECTIIPVKDESTSFVLRWINQSEALVDDICVEKVSFSRARHTITVKKYDGNNQLLSCDSVVVSKSETEDFFVFASNEVNEGKWAQDYSKGICDGSRWEMLVRCGNKAQYNSCGDAGYPPCGSYIENFIKHLMNDAGYSTEGLKLFGGCDYLGW